MEKSHRAKLKEPLTEHFMHKCTSSLSLPSKKSNIHNALPCDLWSITLGTDGERDNFVLCKWCIHTEIKNFKFKNEWENDVYNDDAPKRSGVIEKGIRYFQEIVAMNEAKRVWMKICFCKHINEACIKEVVEHNESKRQICTPRAFAANWKPQISFDLRKMLPGHNLKSVVIISDCPGNKRSCK